MNTSSIGTIVLRAVIVGLFILGLMAAFFGGLMAGNAASGMMSAPPDVVDRVSSIPAIDDASKPPALPQAPVECDPNGNYRILIVHSTVSISLADGLLAEPGVETADNFDA